jgi:hypothetical protein
VPDPAQVGPGWWSDDPVDLPDHDRFDRARFVERAVAVFGEVGARPSSTVVGLVGPWGSGKTSSMRMIVARLPTDRWGIVWLNPWALSGPDAVVQELLGAVAGALPRKGNSADQARRALARYGRYAAPALSLVPVAGSALSGVAKTVVDQITDDGTLEDRSERVHAELHKLKRPVLVVLDDLDRLQPDQLLAVFRAVRVLGRLPYVHYLLAYDQQTLLDVIGATPIADRKVERAVAFLEKIITLRLDQPPVRPEHAEEIFERGVVEALSTAGVTPGYEMWSRLFEERQRLLLRSLTEPRAVARLITQLRIYLPLVGASEVDVVDFLVLTFFRLTYPTLYGALAADRRELTNSSTDDALRDRYSVSRLEQLHIPEADAPRVAGALRRLFPLLSSDLPEQRQRRGYCRVSDPDYVERYFALTAISDDLSDAVLADALKEIIERKRPGSARERLLAALRPEGSNLSEMTRTARILRRAETRCEAAAPAEAAALIPFAVERLTELSDVKAAGVLPRSEAVAWLATLLGRASGLPPIELFRTADSDPSVLPSILRAIRLAVDEPVDETLRRLSTKPESGSWLGQVVAWANDAAWKRLLAHVGLGDAAPDEPISALIAWLDTSLGEKEMDSRLGAAVDAGTGPADLAARFVDVDHRLDHAGYLVVDFVAETFVSRIGYSRLSSPQARALLREASEVEIPMDRRDLSWANRRRTAARGTLRILDDAVLNPGVLLPNIASLHRSPFINPNDSITFDGAEPHALTVAVSVLVPRRVLSSPHPGTDPWGPAVGEREAIILGELERGPIGTWLRQDVYPPHHVGATWQVSEPGSRYFTACRYLRHEGGAPVDAVVEVSTGLAEASSHSDPERCLLLRAGIALSHPVQLGELYGIVDALAQCAGTAAEVFRRLGGAASTVPAGYIRISLSAADDLGRVVRMDALNRVGGGAVGNRFETVASIQIAPIPPGSTGYTPMPDAAVAVLREWLGEAGYRDYESALHNLWRPRSSEPE